MEGGGQARPRDPGSAHQTPGPPLPLPKGHGPAASHRYLSNLSHPRVDPMLSGPGTLCTPVHLHSGPHEGSPELLHVHVRNLGFLCLVIQARCHSEARATQQVGADQVPSTLPRPEPPNSPLRSLGPGQTQEGYQVQASLAVALCTYLEGRGDRGALGPLPAPCPRQKPAVNLHLREEQVACDLAG